MPNNSKRHAFAASPNDKREPIVPITPNRKKRGWFWPLVIIAAALFSWWHFVESPIPTGESEMVLGKKETSEDAANPDVKPDQLKPSFDIVRMEKGEILVSGRAAPGALVHILDGKTEIGTAKADAKGEWVFLPVGRLSPGEKKLSLYTLDSDGKRIRGEQPAVLVVSKKPAEEIAIVAGGSKPSKVLKAPKGQNIGPLRVAKLDYTSNGELRVEGMAEAGSIVRLYIDGDMALEMDVDLGGIFTGETTLRLEERRTILRADMLKDGKVARRVEYKFTPRFFDEDNRALVIRRGDNLWNIAIREYGRGTDYVVLFEANSDQIADPNKIYARQVISVPNKDTERFEQLRKDGGRRVRRTGAYAYQMRRVR